jgi:CO/xanthine dehydrogenase FAD-binding subunit
MRADVSQYELVAPTSLDAALALLAAAPGQHTPIAGGTELMVALNSGRLQQRSLVSLQALRELRFIRVEDDAVHIGAGTTFTDIRNQATIAAELPLLVQSASWTGTIANQNRATLGGNICNASPAADTPPALLAYEAQVVLISTRGQRTMPYTEFHRGYKQTALAADELLYAIIVPRAHAVWTQWIRKVGTRNALAISKVAMACLARVRDGRIDEIRIGVASLADRPLRCTQAEAALVGQRVATNDLQATIARGRTALLAETAPIDDIRSTARYRKAVGANLLEEFLRTL